MRDASQIIIRNNYQWYWTKYREEQTLASDDSGKRQTEKKVLSDQQGTNQRPEWGAGSQSEARVGGGQPIRGWERPHRTEIGRQVSKETQHQQISSNCLMSRRGRGREIMINKNNICQDILWISDVLLLGDYRLSDSECKYLISYLSDCWTGFVLLMENFAKCDFCCFSDAWSEISIKIGLDETGRGYYMWEKTIKCSESFTISFIWIVTQ